MIHIVLKKVKKRLKNRTRGWVNFTCNQWVIFNCQLTHPDDPKEVWIKLEFNYGKRSTKELFEIYEKFFIERVGRELNSKLQIAQGLEGLGPETDDEQIKSAN